jgi:transcriptional regulator with XRE-family HTH domain
MSYFGDLVRRLRKERNMTLEAVAKKIGSHKGYVSGIENGKVNPPSVKFIRKFAKLFNWDERQMVVLAYVDKAPKVIRDEAERLLRSWEDPGAAPSDTATVRVPLLNTVETGYASDLGPDGKPKTLTAQTITMPRSKLNLEFAATICDASMEAAEGATFAKGDIVLLTPETKIANGAIVYAVFNVRGKRRALVRQVMLEQNDHVVLQPLNKDYPLEFLTHDDLDAVYRIVGKIEMFEGATVGSNVS